MLNDRATFVELCRHKIGFESKHPRVLSKIRVLSKSFILFVLVCL